MDKEKTIGGHQLALREHLDAFSVGVNQHDSNVLYNDVSFWHKSFWWRSRNTPRV